MARNRTLMQAPPDTVFDVLCDADNYPRWVVGASAIRDVDTDWPAAGTAFHHRLGVGPLTVADETRVVEIERPHRLVLHAKARPAGSARVTLELEPAPSGTRVTLVEDPGDLLTRLAFTPLTHLLVRVRNAESLRRLKRLAEQRA
jgi:uncharacterized protein YndB with AHSA1/START domain